MEALPVVLEAKMHCVKFWLKVLNNEMYEGRLLRKIAGVQQGNLGEEHGEVCW